MTRTVDLVVNGDDRAHRRYDRCWSAAIPTARWNAVTTRRFLALLARFASWDRRIREEPGSGIHRYYRDGRGHADCVGCVLASPDDVACGHGGSGWNRAHKLVGRALGLG